MCAMGAQRKLIQQRKPKQHEHVPAVVVTVLLDQNCVLSVAVVAGA
jgi:hypothetical protein